MSRRKGEIGGGGGGRRKDVELLNVPELEKTGATGEK